MKQRLWLAIISLLLLVLPVQANIAQIVVPQGSILIVELQTGSLISASEEFIELFNTTDEAIDASTVSVEYKSASGIEWVVKTHFIGQFEPRGRYLLSTYDETANIHKSLGLAATGGHIRIISEGAELDRLAWGTAVDVLHSPAVAPVAGESLKRKLDQDGKFVDSNNDAEDFVISLSPTPQRSAVRVVDEIVAPTNNGEQDTATVVAPNSNSTPSANAQPVLSAEEEVYSKLEISELFIDPQKPLVDNEDEFIELYNPNNNPIELEGYVIETGSKYSYDFTLPALSIQSGQYLALFAIDTGLVLANTSGQARLIDPSGKVVYEVPAYENAKPGVSWAFIMDTWQWTTTPTPNTANTPNPVSSASTTSRSPKSKNTTVLSEGKVLAAADDARTVYEEPEATNQDHIDTAVIAGVGSMALLYAGYEYRYDIGNRFAQLRRYVANRRGNR